MSISSRLFAELEKRGNPQEIYYYLERCLYNAMFCARDRTDDFLDMAHRLADLLEQIAGNSKPKSRITMDRSVRKDEKP